MALTISRVARIVDGNERSVLVDFTADAAYAAGGYALAGSDFQACIGEPIAASVTFAPQVVTFVSEKNAGGYTVSLDKPNSKLKFWLGGTEATTTVSSAVVRARLSYGLSSGR